MGQLNLYSCTDNSSYRIGYLAVAHQGVNGVITVCRLEAPLIALADSSHHAGLCCRDMTEHAIGYPTLPMTKYDIYITSDMNFKGIAQENRAATETFMSHQLRTFIKVIHGKKWSLNFPSPFSSNFPLFLFQIAVHIYYTIDLKDNNSYGPMPWRDGWGAQYSPLIYTPARRHEAWRFLSYMFIHLYHWHLVSNIIMQLILGIPLEMVHGSLRVGIVYCIGVIAGKRTD